MPYKALLLDRDGIVNVDRGYVGDIGRFTFLDGVFTLARHAVDRGFRVVVVTNQSGIARGYFTEAAFLELSDWMRGMFLAQGVELAGIFHCPYHRSAVVERYARDSFWRKPNPGMILDAARRLNLSLSRSVFLGDQPTDMEAARAAGVERRVLLCSEDDPIRQEAATSTIRRHTDLIASLL
ncbi:HAD family hydrolase [Azospirillum brasilense]|uniref:HAD family hydrolase n=1 Tax=Azospirillum brasilense TaxID=192 RepID=UPI000E67F080|nr:HAD family hydrolase [Azospirillum brasilense]NUB24880.1 D-glycero-beta-D-manno-heptose 1,7-bisphosphate 7-phosphatase [Azospirillum brasilense]NUB32555.1 D-glycero-beta-D-manno-heptose 1,7-bisphosphate 7-phosphatase [Azospirillum brasilense]RIW02079.1 HAD family hydrolase [Azospirillum brasilense]